MYVKLVFETQVKTIDREGEVAVTKGPRRDRGQRSVAFLSRRVRLSRRIQPRSELLGVQLRERPGQVTASRCQAGGRGDTPGASVWAGTVGEVRQSRLKW